MGATPSDHVRHGGHRQPKRARCPGAAPARPSCRGRRRARRRTAAGPDADRALVDVERGLVDVEVLAGLGDPGAQPGQRAGYRLQVPREVLAAQALLGGGDRVGAEHPLGRGRQQRRAGRLVHGGRDAPLVGQVGDHPVGAGHRLDQGLEQVRGLMPGLVVEAAHGALHHPVIRDGVGPGTGAHPAPHQAEAGPGVDPAGQRGGQLSDDLAEGVDQVRSQMRPAV